MKFTNIKNAVKKSLFGIVAMGVLIVPNVTSASPMLGGSGFSFEPNNIQYKSSFDGYAMQMEATGYSAYDPGCGHYTATGAYLQYGIAAVDPDVIPLGTSMYVEGYGNAIAADMGGAIVGNRIDLAFDSYQEALNWGRQYVNVYI